jgi:chemotaxis protein CheD
MSARPAAAAAREWTTVVGIAEMAVSDDPGEVLVTYALGSCLGVVVHDPVARVGGMLHVMLPDSRVNREKARANPERFVDTGVPRLFHACYRLGARKERMVVRVAGGARVSRRDGRDSFKIGKRNYVALKKILWKNGALLESEDVGGSRSRTLTFRIGTGQTWIKSDGRQRLL